MQPPPSYTCQQVCGSAPFLNIFFYIGKQFYTNFNKCQQYNIVLLSCTHLVLGGMRMYDLELLCMILRGFSLHNSVLSPLVENLALPSRSYHVIVICFPISYWYEMSFSVEREKDHQLCGLSSLTSEGLLD